MEVDQEKTCSKCKILKPYSEFNADSRRKDGKRASCKECDAKKKKQIREANIEKYRKRNVINNKRYRDRLRQRDMEN